MKELRNDRCSLREITTQHGRTGRAIALRLERLGDFESRFEMSRKLLVQLPVEKVKPKDSTHKEDIGAKRARDGVSSIPAQA